MQIDRNGTGILFLCDEDLELLGVDPALVNNKEFEQIVDYLREHFNEGFTAVLQDAVNYVKGG